MDIFIHNTHISLYKINVLIKPELYDNSWDFSQSSTAFPEAFQGKTLLRLPSIELVQQVIQGIVNEKHPALQRCVILTDDLKAYKKAIKSLFYTLKAAGGLVTNKGKYLLIYRLGKWDLPKGKAEKGETIEVTAVREVEEECNVKVALQDFICGTWHYYPQKGKAMLKKTAWYAMTCTDSTQMTPQTEEDIEKVEWLDEAQLQQALTNTYDSISFVFDSFWEKQ